MKVSVFGFEDQPLKSAQEKPPAKIFDGPGRGRKQCVSCQIYIGVRSRTCPKCSHSFERKNPAPKAPREKKIKRKRVTRSGKEPVEVLTDRSFSVVITPSGRCPEKLASPSPEEVILWANKVQDAGTSKQEIYTASALKYFAREFFDFFSAEYKSVCEVLDREFFDGIREI